MSSPSFFKRNATSLWIIAGFALISILYCLPQLQGKRLAVGDVLSWDASVHQIKSYEDSTGVAPMWSNAMFGGMPTYNIYMSGVHNYVAHIQEAVGYVVPFPALMFFMAMIGFFVLTCTLNINKWLGAVGAFAYAFSTYNPELIGAGHITKMFSIAHMPGVLAGFLMIYNGKRLTGAAVMGLFFTLLLSQSHFQVVYYMAIVLVIAGIAIAITEIKAGRLNNLLIGTGVALLTGLIAVGPSLPVVMSTAEYTKYTMRGGASELKKLKGGEQKTSGGLDKEYAFRWSNDVGELFCILVPNLYGGGAHEDLGPNSETAKTMMSLGVPESSAEQFSESAPTYWGPQPFLAGPIYFGAIICFLFVLGMLVVQSPHKWWILVASILAMLMSAGKNLPSLNYFLFDNLPMYNKFRVPSMTLIIPQLLFPFLGIWALNDILLQKVSPEEIWKKVKTATLITAGLCVVLAFGSSMFFDFKSYGLNHTDDQLMQQFQSNPDAAQRVLKALASDRASMAMHSGLMSAFFIVLAAALIWAFIKNKIKKEMLIAGLGLLIAIDLIPTARKYLNDDNYLDTSDYEAQFQPRPVDAEINKDPDPYYRVLDLSRDTYNDAMQSYHHKTVGGYSAVKMESYQDLIDEHLSGPFNSEVLNMLNTKYIIFNANGQIAYQPNPGAAGNAWFVHNVHYAGNALEEMNAMKAPALGDTANAAGMWKARETAIVRKEAAGELGNKTSFQKDSSASVKLDKYGLNEISFVSVNANEGLAVFSDIYYDKGWKAYVDGKETPIIRADYVLRALKLPAGQHKIVFKFAPATFEKTNTLAMVSSLLLFALFAAALVFAFRKKKGADLPEAVPQKESIK